MTRIAVSAATLLMIATSSMAHAADEADVADLIQQSIEIEGAVNTLRDAGYDVDAATYVASEKKPVATAAAASRTVRVRLTYYVEYGVTASGGHPYAGSTACSWNFPFGTRFRLPDGEVFTCNDRGLLGSSGWLDLWRRPDLARAYGPYATAEVVP